MKRGRSRIFGIGLLVGFLLFPAVTWAMVMGPGDAKQVADEWIENVIDGYGSWGGAESAYAYNNTEFRGEEGSLLGYKFSVHPKGHVVVSLLSQLPPVKSYSTKYDFNVDEEKGYPALLKDTMKTTLDFLENNYGPLDELPEEGISPATNRESWDWLLWDEPRPVRETSQPEEWAPSAVQDLAVGKEVGPNDDTGEGYEFAPDYGPLVQSTWAQGDPYNEYCPMGDGGRTVVGCVATAAAQIANYWKYPQSGTGTHSYWWNGDQSCDGDTPGATLSATYTDTYDWNNMLNSYSGSYTAAQADAVAELSYEMGVAFDMDYGRCASGCYTSDAVTVFPTYFKYADSPVKKDRSDYASADAWFAEIKKEFDNCFPRPIQYRIKGHSIVCDGVRPGATDYMHMNYGWSGGSNGWYAVDNLYCPWSGCGYMEEYAITRIQPLNRIYTYVKGQTSSDIYVRYKTYYGYVQSSWQTVPGGTSQAPAVAVFNNRQYMAVKGSGSNAIYINSRDRWFNWGTWTSISGGTPCSPALAVFNNRLYMFVKGTDNAIYYRYMNTNENWSSWMTVPGGTTSDTPALVVFEDRLFLFVKAATSSSIWYKWMYDNGSWYDHWVQRGGGSTSHAPSAVVYDGKIYLFVKGSSSGNIYYAYTSGTSGTVWHTWREVPGGGSTPTSPNAAVIPQTGALSLAVRGGSGGIYYQGYNPIDGWPGVWSNISGATSDTPVQNTFYYADPWESQGGAILAGEEAVAEVAEFSP